MVILGIVNFWDTEGSSTTYHPMLDCGSYAYWMARIKAYIKFIDEKAWQSMMTELQPTMVETNVGRGP